MAKESSFDVVSTVDMQEVDNAYQQAKKELAAALRPERTPAPRSSLDKGRRRPSTVAAPG